ncbi:exodeoxyribonuclease VII small subunit [Treponema sp.]|uniref:exodeoxyribonuclease VII small subunit n=1 Tax=Treponema sp. TaxID=166 RepID=UPI003F07C117
MTNFEEKLKRLEELSASIKRNDISLEDALGNFEEGIKLAKSMEKTLDEMEGKIQILMSSPAASDNDEKSAQEKKQGAKDSGGPVLGLFDESSEIIGTRKA